MVGKSELLEWAGFASITTAPVYQWEKQISQGKWVVLEIELEGARQIRKVSYSAFLFCRLL